MYACIYVSVYTHNQVAPTVGGQYLGVSDCGKFFWKDSGGDRAPPAEYLITKLGTPSCNVHLLKFFALYEWGLKRPEIIISVTGGAENFDLNSEEKDKIMKVCVCVCVCVCVDI